MTELPSFLIIGAARSGTTNLYYNLKQHPQICMSIYKEANYFVFENGFPDFEYPNLKRLKNRSILNKDDYLNLFPGASKDMFLGEASPLYMYSPGAPQRISNMLPGVKLIAILRDPVERAYSHYLQIIRNSGGKYDFDNALKEKKINKSKLWYQVCVGLGLYRTQILNYYKVFSLDDIKILIYDDLKEDPLKLYQEIYRFLGVDEGVLSQFIDLKFNSSGVPRIKVFDKFLNTLDPVKNIVKNHFPNRIVNLVASAQNWIQNKNIRSPLPVSSFARNFLLQNYYKTEIEGLQEIIGRDLSCWLRKL